MTRMLKRIPSCRQREADCVEKVVVAERLAQTPHRCHLLDQLDGVRVVASGHSPRRRPYAARRQRLHQRYAAHSWKIDIRNQAIDAFSTNRFKEFLGSRERSGGEPRPPQQLPAPRSHSGLVLDYRDRRTLGAHGFKTIRKSAGPAMLPWYDTLGEPDQ